MSQAHSRFKVFVGELAQDKSLGKLGQEIEAWVRESKIAPKSVGIEYLEASKRLVLSIGFADGEESYAVKLTSVSLGKAGHLDEASKAALEKKMESAANTVSNVICHELYITEDGEFLMVFMSRV